MSDEDRIKELENKVLALEYTLKTFIGWMAPTLGKHGVRQLINIYNNKADGNE